MSDQERFGLCLRLRREGLITISDRHDSADLIEQQAQQIAALEKALADAASALPFVAGTIENRIRVYRDDMQRRLESKQAENERLAKDAARYRWLRSHRVIERPHSTDGPRYMEMTFQWDYDKWPAPMTPYPDAAIDALKDAP